MSNQVSDNGQQDYPPEQTTEMLKSFQAAVLSASDRLIQLTNLLHYIYGAAIAGRGDPLVTALQGQDARLVEAFEGVLDVFRKRSIPILEEYTDLLPFILDTQAGIEKVVEEHDDGACLRDTLKKVGDLSSLLNRLLPVQKTVQRPVKKKAPQKLGRPIGMRAVNQYIGRRARELKTQHHASWSQLIDLLIADLNSHQRNEEEQQALEKLLDVKLRTSARDAGSYLRNVIGRYENSLR
jgi:hypothetical protein